MDMMLVLLWVALGGVDMSVIDLAGWIQSSMKGKYSNKSVVDVIGAVAPRHSGPTGSDGALVGEAWRCRADDGEL